MKSFFFLTNFHLGEQSYNSFFFFDFFALALKSEDDADRIKKLMSRERTILREERDDEETRKSPGVEKMVQAFNYSLFVA